MTYKLEVTAGKAVETLLINGKEYSRTVVDEGNGRKDCGDEFSEMLEKDGFDNEEVLDKAWDILDSSFFVSDVVDLCGMAD